MSSAAFRCEATDRNSRSSAYSKANVAWVVHFKSNFKFSLYTTALKKRGGRILICIYALAFIIWESIMGPLLCSCVTVTVKPIKRYD